MKRTALCVSDAHLGIQAAVRKEWLGASWQRCKVHFMRNILAKVPHKEKRRFAAHLKQIWLQPDKKSARRAAAQLVQEYGERFPEATRCLEEGLEDSLQFYAFPEIDPKKISSTNMSERTIREVRRRSRVVGIFPSIPSWVRLDTCYLMEYSEDWPTALGNGTLPQRKFKYYILQDARFLGELSRVFAAGALRAPDSDSALRFAKLAEETITVERSLHENYGKRWRMTAKEMESVPMAPTNYAYTRHMLTIAHTGSAAEITVVALPCAWIYCVVGQHLLKQGPPRKNHPYRAWLVLYASPEFAEVQRWMRKKVDQWAKSAGKEEKRRMEESFVISSRYEWMFWAMAWNEEKWPV